MRTTTRPVSFEARKQYSRVYPILFANYNTSERCRSPICSRLPADTAVCQTRHGRVRGGPRRRTAGGTERAAGARDAGPAGRARPKAEREKGRRGRRPRARLRARHGDRVPAGGTDNRAAPPREAREGAGGRARRAPGRRGRAGRARPPPYSHSGQLQRRRPPPLEHAVHEDAVLAEAAQVEVAPAGGRGVPLSGRRRPVRSGRWRRRGRGGEDLQVAPGDEAGVAHAHVHRALRRVAADGHRALLHQVLELPALQPRHGRRRRRHLSERGAGPPSAAPLRPHRPRSRSRRQTQAGKGPPLNPT